MANALGRSLYLQRNANADGSGTFSSVCGMQDRNLDQSRNVITETAQNCTNLLGSPVTHKQVGTKDQSFSFTAIVEETSTLFDDMQEDFDTGREWTYKVARLRADGTTDHWKLEGKYLITGFNFTGAAEGFLKANIDMQPVATIDPVYAA